MEKVKRALIPAAGLGTRFLPITKAIPKPMLPVLDKPTIQYIVEELDSMGIEEIVVVVAPDSDVIERHFGKAEELEKRLLSDGKQKLYEIEKKTTGFNIKFVVQQTANGLAGAMLSAEKYLKDEPFIMLLGDELLYADKGQKSCIQKLLDTHEQTGKNIIATMEVFGDDICKYGNIGIKSETDGIIEVNGIIEKPSLTEALSNNAIIGRYIFNGGILEKLKKLKPRNNEVYLTDVLDDLAKAGELYAIAIEGERYDVGDKVGYVTANIEFALKSEETREKTAEYLKELVKRLG